MTCKKEQFHKTHQNKKVLTTIETQELQEIYGEISQSEKVMIDLFGIPKYSLECLKHTGI